MRLAKVIATAATAALLTFSAMATPSYAWQWGADNQENYEFNPEHRQEILSYGGHLGADWQEELREAQYASKKQELKNELYSNTNQGTDRAQN